MNDFAETYAHILAVDGSDTKHIQHNTGFLTLEAEVLQASAWDMAKAQGCLVLATQNWNNERLRLWLFSAQGLVYHYDSSPSYLSCQIVGPDGNDALVLAEAFGVPERHKAIAGLLNRRRGRHQQLLGLLGLPAALATAQQG
jgi:hypothetical protein